MAPLWFIFGVRFLMRFLERILEEYTHHYGSRWRMMPGSAGGGDSLQEIPLADFTGSKAHTPAAGLQPGAADPVARWAFPATVPGIVGLRVGGFVGG